MALLSLSLMPNPKTSTHSEPERQLHPEIMMDFDDPAGLAKLEAMSAQRLDDLAFGVVRMRSDGEVVEYNTLESSMAGLSKERVLARNFFTDIAPCTNNYMVAERFMSEPELDATLDYIFTLRMKPTAIRLRLFVGAGVNPLLFAGEVAVLSPAVVVDAVCAQA